MKWDVIDLSTERSITKIEPHYFTPHASGSEDTILDFADGVLNAFINS